MKFVNRAISTIADKGTPNNHSNSPLAIWLSVFIPEFENVSLPQIHHLSVAVPARTT